MYKNENWPWVIACGIRTRKWIIHSRFDKLFSAVNRLQCAHWWEHFAKIEPMAALLSQCKIIFILNGFSLPLLSLFFFADVYFSSSISIKNVNLLSEKRNNFTSTNDIEHKIINSIYNPTRYSTFATAAVAHFPSQIFAIFTVWWIYFLVV